MATYKVTLLSEAENLNVTIDCPDDKFILEAAEDNNIELPYSCRAGSCSTCLGKVTSGTIDQPDQTFLDEDQTGAGFILTCVAYPTSNTKLPKHVEQDPARHE
jgi:ferredoxin